MSMYIGLVVGIKSDIMREKDCLRQIYDCNTAVAGFVNNLSEYG